MEISGRDISIATSGGGFRLIQDLVPGDSVMCTVGHARVVSVTTAVGHVYPLRIGRTRVYVPNSQKLSVQVDAAGGLVQIAPLDAHNMGAPVTMYKPGVVAFQADTTYKSLDNVAVFGRWINTDTHRLSVFASQLPKRKHSLLTHLVSVMTDNELENNSVTIPSIIMYSSLRTRFSFVRGVITGSTYKICRKPDGHELNFVLFNKKISAQLVELLGSLGYNAVSTGSVVIVHAPRRADICALISRKHKKLPRTAATTRVDVEISRSTVYYQVCFDRTAPLYINDYIIL